MFQKRRNAWGITSIYKQRKKTRHIIINFCRCHVQHIHTQRKKNYEVRDRQIALIGWRGYLSCVRLIFYGLFPSNPFATAHCLSLNLIKHEITCQERKNKTWRKPNFLLFEFFFRSFVYFYIFLLQATQDSSNEIYERLINLEIM